jgi:hypothetical protein
MSTELNKKKQVVQSKNTSLKVYLYCYTIISVIIIIIINDGYVSGGCVDGVVIF